MGPYITQPSPRNGQVLRRVHFLPEGLPENRPAAAAATAVPSPPRASRHRCALRPASSSNPSGGPAVRRRPHRSPAGRPCGSPLGTLADYASPGDRAAVCTGARETAAAVRTGARETVPPPSARIRVEPGSHQLVIQSSVS